MPGSKPAEVFVAICDWKGRLTWRSSSTGRIPLGQTAWLAFQEADAKRLMDAFARTVALGERHQVEATTKDGLLYRIWLWPLGSADFAVCSLNVRVPNEIRLLTERERECLRLMATGRASKEIAKQLDVSLSTVHTHVRRIREKLKLPSIDAVLSFAGRYFHPGTVPPSVVPASPKAVSPPAAPTNEKAESERPTARASVSPPRRRATSRRP